MFEHPDISELISPFWKEAHEEFIKTLDIDELRKLTPQEIFSLARTQEELISLGKVVQQIHGSGSVWRSYYNIRRLELGKLPSRDPRTGKFYAPISPTETFRPGRKTTDLSSRIVNRNLYGQGLTFKQITGQEDVFSLFEKNRISSSLKRSSNGVYQANKTPRRVITFDIETTGAQFGKGHQIVSLGMTINGKKESIYADFPKKKYEDFIENVIRPQWQKGVAASGKAVTSEKELIKGFINIINEGDTTVRGYNIKAFDLPFLHEAASRHGLGEQFKSAVRKANLDDVMEQAYEFLVGKVGQTHVGFTFRRPEHGLKTAGYKLEALAAGFGYKSSVGTHEALQDVEITNFLSDILKDPKRQKNWDITAWENKTEELTGTRPLRYAPGMEKIDFSAKMGKDETYYTKSFMEHAKKQYPGTIKGPFYNRPIEHILNDIQTPVVKPLSAGKNTILSSNKTLDFVRKQGSKTISTINTKAGMKLALGIGGAFLGTMAAGGTIDNILSSGPGYGLPQPISENKINNLYGITTPQTSQEFFQRDEDTEISNFKAQLAGQIAARKGPPIGTQSSGSSKILPSELKQISGSAAEIDLSKFNYKFVDADTVELTPKGIRNSIISGRDPILVRLSGLDAPEVSHGERAAMPQAGPATAKAEKMLENNNLRLVISTDPAARTKGRYLGLAYTTDSSKPLNLRLVEEGFASALTYNEGLIDQKQYQKAEKKAIKENLGIWQLDYYKQYREERRNRPGRLTFNVLSSAPDQDIQEARLRVKSSLFRRDEHLQVEGLDHYNVAQHVRHFNTDFGSSWDLVRSIAKGMYKNADPEDAFKMLKENPAFREAIQAAVSSPGEKIGAGLTADVFSHRVSFKHGIADLPEEFDIVSKRYRTNELNQQVAGQAFMNLPQNQQELLEGSGIEDWLGTMAQRNEPHALKQIGQYSSMEGRALEKLGSLNAPSLYGTGKQYGLDDNVLIMEKFKGDILGDIPLSSPEAKELHSFITESHKRGVYHTDLHLENIMRVDTPQGKKIGVIDYGMANRLSGGASATYERDIKDYVSGAAQKLGIGDVSAEKFQQTIDINRIYSHALKGETGVGLNIPQERISGIGHSFTELVKISQSGNVGRTKEAVMIAEDMLRTTDEASEFFGAPKPFNMKRKSELERASKQILTSEKTPAEFFSSPRTINEGTIPDSTIEGLHPDSAFGLGTLNLKKTTDFGSGSQIAIDMWKSLSRKGTTLENASGKLLDYIKSKGIKVFTNRGEAIKEYKEITKPALIEKGLIGGKSDIQIQKAISKRRPHTVSSLEEGYIYLPEISGKNKDLFTVSHEGLEFLHSKKVGFFNQLKETVPRFATRKAAKQFGSHERIQVIKDEAFIAYMQGDEAFQLAKAKRLKEVANIGKAKTQQELIDDLKYIRDLKKQKKILSSVDQIKELEARISNNTKWYKQDAYRFRTEEIYHKAPQEVEAQIKELGLVRGLGNRSVLKEQLARMNRFRRSAIAAVGIGHKTARNAGRKHCNFASTGQK